MPYEMQGIFLEACDCRVICPCWFNEHPTEDSCTGLIAWYVEKGAIDGVDVSNLAVTSFSHHEGHRHSGGQEVVLVIDQNASEVQAQALERAFSGALGGPLQELRELSGGDPIVRRAPIHYADDGRNTTVTVGDSPAVSTVEMYPLVGALGRVTTLADSALAIVLGTPTEVGKSARLLININRAPLDTDLKDRSASRGRFSYRHSAA